MRGEAEGERRGGGEERSVDKCSGFVTAVGAAEQSQLGQSLITRTAAPGRQHRLGESERDTGQAGRQSCRRAEVERKCATCPGHADITLPLARGSDAGG